jgi:hypothetical protein
VGGNSQSDSAGGAESDGVIFAALLFLFGPAALPRQNARQQPSLARIEQLYRQNRYREMLDLVPASPQNSPPLDLYRGMALARLRQWQEAREALEAGRAKAPKDPRFLVELAGVEFSTQKFEAAKTDLRKALALDPKDAYARNFLATIYFFTGNLEAAIENWNDIGQPRISGMLMQPQPRLRAKLLSGALGFRPDGTLRLSALRGAEARIENLDVFSRYRFELMPRSRGDYELDFISEERNGWGSSKLEALASILRDLPFAVDPAYYNIGGSAMNFVSYIRLNENRRRISASLSRPLGDDPRWRISLDEDARNENWNLSRTFSGASVPLSDLNLESIAFGPELREVVNGNWSWQTRLVYTYRRFRNVRDVAPSALPLFTGGNSLEDRTRFDIRLLDLPGRRLTLGAGLGAAAGRNFASSLGAFGSVEGSLDLEWYPKPLGQDYHTSLEFRTGRVFGSATFDEFYELGVERDNDLWVRGINGIRGGFKGNAPLGREFALWNWETDKTVFHSLYVTIQVGPFMDIGRVWDPSGYFGSKFWLWDPGLQCSFRVFGDVVVRISYGRDLHTGQSTLYETASR